jgi:tetratricopeptide (TPR) repeat protein
MKEKQIILLGIAAAIIACFVAWAYYNRRNEEKARLRRPTGPGSQQRAADQKPLTRQEIRIKKQAGKLISRGRILPAAQMLEQAGFYRDAIDALENGRLFDDAARVLIRLQRPGRAGVLYSRNGLFGPAAQCFLQAGDSLNAAKCFREIGKTLEAAELFAKAAQFAEAAECLEKANLLSDAAKNWLKVNKTSKAVVCWNALGQDPQQLAAYKPHQDELDIMIHSIKSDPDLPGILKILARSNQAGSYILDLLSDQIFETAKKIFNQSPQSVQASLVGSVNIQSPAAILLAEMYRESAQYRNAGILLEQLERFEEAAESFRAAGDSERSKYCSNRAKKGKMPQLQVTEQQMQGTPQINIAPSARSGFFIDPGTQSSLKSALEIPRPEIAVSKVLKLPLEPSTKPSQNMPLASDEMTLLSRTWLLQGLNEEDVEMLVSRFSAFEYQAGHRIQSGAPNTFLVMVITGDLISSDYPETADGWLSPEIGLSERNPVEWIVTSSQARTVTINTLDFSAILSRNADLTRQVYMNLTLRLLSLGSKPLISKAV